MSWSLIVPPIIAIIAIVALTKFVRNKQRLVNTSQIFSEPKFDEKHSSEIDGVIERAERWGMDIFSKIFQFGKLISLSVSRKVASWGKITALSNRKMTFFKKTLELNLKTADGIVRTKSKEEKEEEMVMKKQYIDRPALQEKVATPRKKVPLKDAYEETLIDRIATNPRDVGAYESLGDFYLNQQNLEDARECYRQIIKIDSRHRGAKVRLHRLERILER